MFSHKINVPPLHQAVVYKNNTKHDLVESGTHTYRGSKNSYHYILFPTTLQTETIHGQEILTQDNIAFRFSCIVEYKVADIDKVVDSFDMWEVDNNNKITVSYHNLYQQLREYTKVAIRESVAKHDATDLNTNRKELVDSIPNQLNEIFTDKGIHFERVAVTDITFPKFVQEKFAYELQAKLKAKVDLENARAQVATARTLKNASKMIEESPNIQYLLYLETLKEISKNGSHSFEIEK